MADHKMKRLYSLGDSFMTTDDPDCGITSFCELYCQQRGFEHVSLARPGATVFATRLQIEKAIDEHADYVVVGATCSDRFDIALDIKEHVPSYTLDNVWYTNYLARSEKHVDQTNVKIVSDTVNNLFAKKHQDLVSSDQLQALKAYITYLHNPMLASQREYYMLSDGLRKLQSAGIDFVLIPGWMSHHDWSWVSRVWPKESPSPYQMPYGPAGWDNPPRYTGTHNPAWAHQEFCETLASIAKDWC